MGSNPTVVVAVNITKGWYEMTKKEFQKKYPDGMNIQIVAFKKAYSEVVTDWDFPFEPYLNGIKSPTLLRDAIAIMCELFKESVYKGETEADK